MERPKRIIMDNNILVYYSSVTGIQVMQRMFENLGQLERKNNVKFIGIYYYILRRHNV